MLNITFKDSVIGDDLGSSPWAIKLKTDSQEGGTVDGIFFINLTIGNSTCPKMFPHVVLCCVVGLSLHSDAVCSYFLSLLVVATVRACSTLLGLHYLACPRHITL